MIKELTRVATETALLGACLLVMAGIATNIPLA
jgi:hypothetical protein